MAKAIRLNSPEKKGYSERNLTYMCQFAKAYPLRTLQNFIETDAKLIAPSVEKIADEVCYLNNVQFTQEPLAQIQSIDNKEITITQEPLAQIHNVARTVSDIYRMEIKDIENIFMASPVARTNWASHVIMLNSSLPLGVSYWYMKQSVEMGWSSNVLKIQIETNLYSRQISNNKVNNFTATLPAVEMLGDVSYNLSAAFRNLSARSHRPPLNTVSSSSVNPPAPPFPSMPLSLL